MLVAYVAITSSTKGTKDRALLGRTAQKRGENVYDKRENGQRR